MILEANPLLEQPRFAMMKGYLQTYKVKIPLLLKSGIASRATKIMRAVKHWLDLKRKIANLKMIQMPVMTMLLQP